MTRTIKPSEIRPGMEVQWTLLGVERRCTVAGVDTGRPGGGANLCTSEGGGTHVPGDVVVTVLAEPQPDEPSPGSVVRTPGGDMFCRTGSKGGSWQRVNGKGLAWTWNEILSLDGDPEILFDPEADVEQHGVPTRIEKLEDWSDEDPELRKYSWIDADFDTWKWSPAHEDWRVVHEDGYVQYQTKRFTDLASFPITRAV